MMLWPVSFEFEAAFVMSPRRNCGFLILDSVHVISNISEKAVMIIRKITGDRLSPWRTPTVCAIVAFSVPILRVTVRSV